MPTYIPTRNQEELRQPLGTFRTRAEATAAIDADRKRIRSECRAFGFVPCSELLRGAEFADVVVEQSDGSWLTQYGWSIEKIG